MENTQLIAEIGQAHEGSLGIAHSYIDALYKTGVRIVKFQTHIADAESSSSEPFRTNFSYEDKTRFDYWKRMEFDEDQWAGLKKHCDDLGMEFLSSPFSLKAVDLLEKIGVERYKIGSGEITNFLMLEKVARTGKPVILSSGMSNFNEISEALKIVKRYHSKISILQCTTSYPTKPEQWGLNIINELKEKFKLQVGFSDHSGEIYPCLFAAALGASILEFHCVFDKQMFGPDSFSSLTMSEITLLHKGVSQLDIARNNPINKNNLDDFKDLKNMFGKSLAVNRNMQKGEIISLNSLEAKKPSNKGIPASEFERILGKRVNKFINQWDFLNYNDIV